MHSTGLSTGYSQYAQVQASSIWGRLNRRWIKELSGNELKVAIMLASFDGKDGCYPATQTLADETGMQTTHVYAALRSLEKRGFFIRRKLGRRTYYDLQPSPKVTYLVTERDRIRQSTVTESVTAYKVREQTNGTDQEQTASPPSAQVDMGRIVGEVKRTPATQAATPTTVPRRPRSEREETIRELVGWFSQHCFAPLDFSKRDLMLWNALLDRCNGDVKLLQTICQEAAAIRDKLCTDEHPVWSVQTVWFYVKYKRKEKPVADHESVIRTHVFGQTVVSIPRLREYVKLHGVPESTVRGVLRDLYEQVYPEDCG